MYTFTLLLHSWTRWLVLIFGLIALFRAIGGLNGRPWTKADNGMGAAFVGSMHLQLLLGVLLYFGLSPWGMQAFQRLGGAVMKNPESRFWGVEHIAAMVLAAAAAQVGRSLSKKLAPTHPHLAHKRAAVWFGIALLLVLLMIPWGVWNPARPLFRF